MPPADSSTPPPARRRRKGGPRFVIQEHHARSLHWDFRLERDGVLVSWAVPKGLPPDKGTNHLAVHVEDHPLEYAGFEGEIPAGEYGAGQVSIWDDGTFDELKWSDRKVEVHLHGRRVDARYALFQTKDTQWMIHRMDPAPAGWEPMPSLVRPMLAVAGALPDDRGGEWAYEFKWDGVRVVAYVDGGRIRLLSRNDKDVTASYPELRALGAALGPRQVVLDGEIVALRDGRPSFEALQARMHVTDERKVRRLAAEVPVAYMVFDVLYVDGAETSGLAYDERRRVLQALALDGPNWATPAANDGPGADVLAAARSGGLEGVVAKRRDAPYRPGRRDGAWVKVKPERTQEVVIGGFAPGRASRTDALGALLLGVPADGHKGKLVYVGRVGSGFTQAGLADMRQRLERIERPDSPFVDELSATDRAGARWVAPRLVGEVSYAEWTRTGRLRHPVWRGLRPDKRPSEVTREP
jgi:bifunctional non-homologous end joining protein LigD